METSVQATVLDWDARAVKHITLAADSKMTWRVWGTGPALLLIHGNNGSWTHWIRNLETLARHHTLYVPDLPGHGDSELPRNETTCQAFAKMLWQGVDQILAPDAVVDIAGFSLGSVLAESMAMQCPDRVRKLVLLRGSFTPMVPKVPDTVLRWRGIEDPLEMERVQRHNLGVMLFHDSNKIDQLAIETHLDNLLRCTLDTRSLLASRCYDAFTTLKCQVYGISGEFDVYGAGRVEAQGEALRASLPQAEFHLLRGVGHWAIYEAADEVNAVMVSALA